MITQELIRRLRLQGLTLEAIHDVTGIKTTTLQKWSTGANEAPVDKYRILEGLLK